jgi:predicted transcriptional regulator of viral defense system
MANPKLVNLAVRQAGLFTVKQGVVCGIDRTHTSRYIKTGAWEKVGEGSLGLYRLVGLDIDKEHESKWIAYLWAIGRDGVPQGVISHESALEIWAVSDVSPTEVHLTVRRGFRRRTQPPVQIFLHQIDYSDHDVAELDSELRVMSLLSTVRDLLREDRLSREYIEQAFIEGMTEGKISLMQLHKQKGFARSEKALLEKWLEQSGKDPRK